MSDLIIKNLCKSFGEKKVFEDFNARFEAGKIVWLKADSGAGKTTLFRIIAGLEKADSGEVSFDGEVVYCFQEDRLVDELSAVENVLAVVGKKRVKAELVEYIKSHLAELGLQEADVLKPVSELSGGMKRRVALARAVCYMTMGLASLTGDDFGDNNSNGKETKRASKILLLLDEPFTGLDEANKARAVQYIKKHKGGATVLIASHEMVEGDICIL